MISAPCSRAASTNFFTFGTESAQRLRFSGVQVCTVKSITSNAVSFGTIVTGLSCGGGGNLASLLSSTIVSARATKTPAPTRHPAAISIETDNRRIVSSSRLFCRHLTLPPDGRKGRVVLYFRRSGRAARLDGKEQKHDQGEALCVI